MAATAVLVNSSAFNRQFYSLIPELCCAVKSFADKKAEEAIDQLGPIFVKHGTFQRYGLTMIHRHFGMIDEELLVEAVNGDQTMSVAMPWKVMESGQVTGDGLKLVPSDDQLWNSYSLPAQPFVEPSTWAFDNEGNLLPFEFHATSELEAGAGFLPHDFVKELYEALQELSLETVFGLRRIRRTCTSYETTPEGVRANVTQFGMPPPDSDSRKFVKVVYRIDENGKGKANLHCILCFSCHHCDHCHCNTCEGGTV